MANLILNLDDVQLPVEDQQKPVEHKNDDAPVTDPTPVTPPATVTPTTPTDPPAADPAATPATPDPVTPPVTDPTQNPAGDQNQDPLTPFHKHPDWIKMQREKEELQAEVETLRKQASAQSPAAPAPVATAAPQPLPELTGYEGMSKGVIFEKLMQDKVKAGWKPETQLDYDTVKQQILDRAEELKATADSTLNKRTQIEVNNKYIELGVTDPQEQKAIKDLVLDWANKGTSISLATFDIAAQNLRLQGKIKDPSKPATTVSQPAVPAQAPVAPVAPVTPTTPPAPSAADARDAVNRQISKPKSSGAETNNGKPTYKEIHNQDLDTLVVSLSSKLG